MLEKKHCAPYEPMSLIVTGLTGQQVEQLVLPISSLMDNGSFLLKYTGLLL